MNKLTKKLFHALGALLLALCLAFSFAACTAAETSTGSDTGSTGESDASVAGTYTCTYTNSMGSEETAQIVLNEDGTCELSFPGDDILGSDVYTGTYTYETDDGVTTVSIVGLIQEDNDVSAYPALWTGWIDSETGNCQITLNSDGTFDRVLTDEDTETYVSGLYTYTEDDVTYQLELSMDGSCGFKEGDDDWVEGTYSMDGSTVTVNISAYEGDASFVYDGVLTVTVNSDNTFTPITQGTTYATYTYEESVYIEMVDVTTTETAILVLYEDRTCTLTKDGSLMLTDTYYETYTLSADGSTAYVTDLVDSNGDQIPGSDATIGYSFVIDGTFTASLSSDGTFVPVTLTAEEAAGTYTYTYTNGLGVEETMQIVLDEDGNITLSMPDHLYITDSYTGTYTISGNSVNVVFSDMHSLLADNFTAEDDGTYTATITLNTTAYTFTFGTDSSDEDEEEEAWEGGTVYEDLAYVEDGTSDQVMDLYVPDSDTAMPLFVTIHGGAFTMGDADMMSDIYEYFRDEGYVVASLNYTLGAGTYPAAVQDCKTAVQFLCDNAKTYNIDTGNIILMGESAGSCIASLVALSGASDFMMDDQETAYTFSVTTYVDFYGPVSNGNSSLDSSYINGGVTNWLGDSEAVDLADYLDETTCTNIWIQHGDSDTTVNYAQAEAFYTLLTDYNANTAEKFNVYYELLEGAVHMDDAFYTDENLASLLSWLTEIEA